MVMKLRLKMTTVMLKMEMLLLLAMSMLFSSTTVGVAVPAVPAVPAATNILNSASGEWSMSNVVDMSSLSSSASASASPNDYLLVLQEQTSRLLGDAYDAVAEQTRRIGDRINANLVGDVYEYEYLRKTLDSATAPLSAFADASPQQWQIINDAVSMLSANYAYDAAQREIDLHRECIAAAYADLSNAARIVIDGATTTTTTTDASNWQRMRQIRERVLSAVRHLQDSCPLCRALKYAASEANQNLLPFVTVLCSSILKTLHPSLAVPDP